ncbi:MAG TPA: DNA internalization-related competence protein ComEC/Rec2 [Anaerolineae bacterium]|jgi:competence protein ComEC|nr:DNA internalization-related competence protein ComEC/Rec2 [Anaerolineae bacterium]
MTIIYVGIAWLVGLAAAAMTAGPLWLWLTIGVGALLAALLLRHHPEPRRWLVLVAFFCLGAARYESAAPIIDPDHIANYNDAGEVILIATVAEEPMIRDQRVQLRLESQSVISGNGLQPVEGLVLLTTGRYPVHSYGTRLQLRGELRSPADHPKYDIRDRLAREGIFSEMTWTDIEILDHNGGNPFYRAIYAVKDRARAVILRQLPEPHAALLTGILLGDDSGMPAELAEQFRSTGITHIIAISGFNIAILAAILLRGSRPVVGPRWSAWVAIGGVAIYTILVGADPAVVRAAIMGGIFIFAGRVMGRPSFAPAGLMSAIIVMTLVEPTIIWSIGFQLSVAATLGLMLYVAPWKQWAEASAQRFVSPSAVRSLVRFLADIFIATLAAMLLTMPLIVFHFKQLSVISPLANLFILPAQPGVMTWGILSTLTGMAVPIVGQGLAWVTWFFLNYTIGRVQFFASLPAASVGVNLSPAGLIALYIIIFGLTWLAKIGPNRRRDAFLWLSQNVTRRLALAGSAMIAVLALSWALNQPDGRLHVAFFDVGQGDATFIQTPSGRQILIDGGAYPTVLQDHLGREIPFWDRDIDLVIVTHPDADHAAGLPGVFDHYDVGRLIANGQTADEQSYQALLIAAGGNDVPIHNTLAGETITIEDGVTLQILNPTSPQPLTPEPQHDNDQSVALRLVYGDFSLLMTGDAGQPAETQMLRSGRNLQSLVYKAGHHGAKTSNSAAFLDAVRPQIMVVTAGSENWYGHPDQEVLERAGALGTAVLRTDELGTIELISDGQGMWWESHQ